MIRKTFLLLAALLLAPAAQAQSFHTWATQTAQPSANIQSLLGASSYANARDLLDLEYGVNVYTVGTLNSTSSGQGAALIGIFDSAAATACTNVECALAELYAGSGGIDEHFADSEKLYFGTSDDVEFYFNGTNYYTAFTTGSDPKWFVTGSAEMHVQDRIWSGPSETAGLIVFPEDDGGDIAIWRGNSDNSALDYDFFGASQPGGFIGHIYFSAWDGTAIIPNTSYTNFYTCYYDCEDHPVVGGSEAGPYSYGDVSDASGDVAVFVRGAADSEMAGQITGIQVKDVDYTIDTGANTITFIGGQEPTAGDLITIYRRVNYAGQGPFIGRSAEWTASMMEDATPYARGAESTIYGTRIGQVVARPMQTWMPAGDIIIWGRSPFEADTRCRYPDNRHLSPADTNYYRGFCSDLNPRTYAGSGTFTILAPDDSVKSAFAIRADDDTDEGFGIAYDHAGGRLLFQIANNDVTSTVGGINLDGVTTRSWYLGAVPGVASFDYLTISGRAAGSDALIAATGAATDVGIEIAAKGAADVLISSPLTLTSKLAFPATQVASTGANDFDDYEEGTWTPVLTTSSPGTLSVAYTSQAGRYTKVGRQVVAEFDIFTSSFTLGTASGDILVSGLPFASNNVTEGVGSVHYRGLDPSAGYTQINAYTKNASTLKLRASGDSVNDTDLQTTEVDSGTNILLRGTVTYTVP